jgi:hypothetical protein
VPVPGVRLLRGVRAAPPRPHPGRARPRQGEQLQPRRVRVAGVAVPEQAAVPGAPGPCGTARVPAAQRRGRSLGSVTVGGLPRPAPRAPRPTSRWSSSWRWASPANPARSRCRQRAPWPACAAGRGNTLFMPDAYYSLDRVVVKVHVDHAHALGCVHFTKSR